MQTLIIVFEAVFQSKSHCVNQRQVQLQIYIRILCKAISSTLPIELNVFVFIQIFIFALKFVFILITPKCITTKVKIDHFTMISNVMQLLTKYLFSIQNVGIERNLTDRFSLMKWILYCLSSSLRKICIKINLYLNFRRHGARTMTTFPFLISFLSSLSRNGMFRCLDEYFHLILGFSFKQVCLALIYKMKN